ncbi:Hypp8971 [Branchiostoma lanceolatum]|uniref:Hypp8971 protein n=1 Tax=Branchiostoma lanceolatum TaxID=7740 RepID=A0A8J9ZAM0_BRALA|nr:Hypp8971 [Branchiostoma lanceolatum]
MRIVVAFVSAVLLALQLAPTSALVIRPRRELPDFFSKILQRAWWTIAAILGKKMETSVFLQNCTRDEDCEGGQVCFNTGLSFSVCAPSDPCPPESLPNWQEECARLGEPLFPAVSEGFHCDFTHDCKAGSMCHDCKEGLCCEQSDGGSNVCKPFAEKGEPCKQGDGMSWLQPAMRQGCCKAGLRCGDDGVCIVDEDFVSSDEIPWQLKSPAANEKTDDNPEKIDDNPEKKDHSPEKNDDNPEKTGDNRDKIDDSPE